MGTKRVGWARIRSLINENENELKFRNAQIVTCTGTTTLTAAQSGAIVDWTHSSAHDITLPAAKKGLTFRFVIAKGHTAEHRILIVGDDHFVGRAQVTSGDTADKTATQIANKGDNMIHINLQANATTLGGDIGDTVDVVCLEDGFWTVSAQLTVRSGNPGSLAVFSAT
tara:strand:- start:169 stop:675 length:507 start_codon:yes stop_codon:yes gene_type:complete